MSPAPASGQKEKNVSKVAKARVATRSVVMPEKVEVSTTLFEDIYRGAQRTGRQRASEVKVLLMSHQVEGWRRAKEAEGFDVGHLHVRAFN